MTTTVRTFRELALRAEAVGLAPRIQAGDVFWVDNRTLKRYTRSFTDCDQNNFHAAVVISTGKKNANIRVITSKVKRYRRDGIFFRPGPEVALKRPGVILTRRALRRRVPLPAIKQQAYLGNVGPEVLKQVRLAELQQAAGRTQPPPYTERAA